MAYPYHNPGTGVHIQVNSPGVNLSLAAGKLNFEQAHETIDIAEKLEKKLIALRKDGE